MTCLRLHGYVTHRRVLGRSCAFASLDVYDCAECSCAETAATLCKQPLAGTASEDAAGGAGGEKAADAVVVDSIGDLRFDVDREGVVQSLNGILCQVPLLASAKDSSDLDRRSAGFRCMVAFEARHFLEPTKDRAAFPTRRSLLHLGDDVEVHLYSAASLIRHTAYVRWWRVHERFSGRGFTRPKPPELDMHVITSSRIAVQPECGLVGAEPRSAAEAQCTAALCKAWVRGVCRAPESTGIASCGRRHYTIGDLEQELASALHADHLARIERTRAEDALYSNDSPAGGRKRAAHGVGKAEKGLRARVFAEFVAMTFKRELAHSPVVLDVAGGNGAVSVELARLCEAKCVVIDPKPRKRKLLARKDWALRGSVEFLNVALDESFLASAGGVELLNSASLIIGMHPDEATEPLVVTAIAHCISFAVVPCCVFSQVHPERRHCGLPVRTLGEFCQYLSALGCDAGWRVQSMNLGFEGRDRVLFARPPRLAPDGRFCSPASRLMSESDKTT